MNPKYSIKKADIYLMIFLFALCFVSKIPMFNYPIAGDSVSYLMLAEDIYENQSYNLDGVEHTKYPPGWPMFIVLFLPFFKNPIWAIKLAGMIISSSIIVCTYLISRLFGVGKRGSVIISLLLMFNPWFFYFSGGFLPGSEGLAIFLFMLAIIFLVIKNENFDYLSAILFSLACITRIDIIFYVAPFLLWYGINIIKRKHTKKSLLFIFLSTFPLMLWYLRSLLITSNIIGGYGFLKFHLSDIPILSFYMLLSIILAFSLLLPFVIYGQYRLIREGKKLWMNILMGYLIHIIIILLLDFVTADPLIFITMRTRRSLLVMPFFIIASYLSIGYLNPKFQRITKTCFALFIPVFIMLTIVMNFGFVQEQTNKFIDLGNTFTLRSYHRAKAIEWINDRADTGSLIIGDFNEDMRIEYLELYFRDDVDYVDIEDFNSRPGQIYVVSELSTRNIAENWDVIEIQQFNNIKIYNVYIR